MRKRILLLIFFIFIIILLVVDKYFYKELYCKVLSVNGNMDFAFIEEIILEEKERCEFKITEIQKYIKEIEKQKRVKKEFNEKINSIAFKNKKQDFLIYKEILNDYTKYSYLEMPKTVYDEYGTNEIKIFQKLIAAETTGGDFESKCNVASVIWNRLHSEKYPNNIIDVIYERNGSVQFSPTYDGRIETVEVTYDDILAVEYTYMFGSTAYDCIAFDNVSGSSWNKSKLEMIFTDSIGHSFYR